MFLALNFKLTKIKTIAIIRQSKSLRNQKSRLPTLLQLGVKKFIRDFLNVLFLPYYINPSGVLEWPIGCIPDTPSHCLKFGKEQKIPPSVLTIAGLDCDFFKNKTVDILCRTFNMYESQGSLSALDAKCTTHKQATFENTCFLVDLPCRW